jgi:3-isopropylmalate/(R)-2-methylmalate dehydratase large subunit
MATGKCWLKIPESIKLIFSGKLGKWVSGKDLILYTIGKIGVDGASYKAMEITGEVIHELEIADRFTICNMTIEAGAKNGIIAPDNSTTSYLKSNGFPLGTYYQSDPDAEYIETIEITCDTIEPQVALPHSPENTKPISEVDDMNINIDQIVIGSCTNGRIEDLRIVAKILKNQKIIPNLRCIIIPGTQHIYLKAIKEGLVEIFVRAGAIVSTPTCGPCLGGHMGILGEGEKALSTTNRNFKGRMGHISSEIFLSSPAIAAFSAIKGYITSPKKS